MAHTRNPKIVEFNTRSPSPSTKEFRPSFQRNGPDRAKNAAQHFTTAIVISYREKMLAII
ncbi:MAG: hypothetical protein PHD19_13660 [Dechloromonas sp.]|nr:hypothetical protein [Dechloromonas sp.]